MKYLILSMLFFSQVNFAEDTEHTESIQLELSKIRIRVQTPVGVEIPLIAKLTIKPMVELHLEK